MLLSVIGDEALEVYQTFEWEAEGDKHKPEKVLEMFEKYCIPRTNVLFETYCFGSRRQEDGESVDMYVTALRRIAENCEFQDKDRRIRDQLVLGLRDDKTREILLREPDPDLKKVITLVRANEVALQQSKQMTESQQGEANKVHFLKYHGKYNGKKTGQ